MPAKIRKYAMICLFTLAGCSDTLHLPTEHDLALAPVNGNNMDIESLDNGYNLYVNKCGSCHYLYRPTRFSEEKWKMEVPKMAGKAKLSQEQQELVLQYLLTMREAELAENTSK